jgi:predicted phosphodiesterase
VRLLCLSDIHGHAAALSAVLASAERKGYARVLVAGDICFPGPEPLVTWQRLHQLRALCVQGVGDRALATVDAERLRPRDDFERARLKRLHDVRAELGDAVLRQLAKLPAIARHPLPGGRQLVLVHGSPSDPLEPLTHDMDDVALAHMLGDEPADVVLCGGSHVPFDRLVARSREGVPAVTRVVNLGSVGEAPNKTSMGDEGSEMRVAHATFLDASEAGVEVEQFVVPYGEGRLVFEGVAMR